MKLPFLQRNTASDSSLTLQQVVLMLAIFGVLAVTLPAAQPVWWNSSGAVNPLATTNDYAAANQGQLKQFTQKADLYLDANLTNGAGGTLDSLVAGWSNYYQANGYSSTTPYPNDFKIVNQAQLKYIASLVYAPLHAQGFMSSYPTWLQTNADDFQAASLGQVKTVFNFDYAPPTPSNLLVVLAGTQATLTWSGSPTNLQNYVVQYSSNGGATWTTAATVSPTTYSNVITGLTLGTNYKFRVLANGSAYFSSTSSNDAAPVITLSTPTGTTLVP